MQQGKAAALFFFFYAVFSSLWLLVELFHFCFLLILCLRKQMEGLVWVYMFWSLECLSHVQILSERVVFRFVKPFYMNVLFRISLLHQFLYCFWFVWSLKLSSLLLSYMNLVCVSHDWEKLQKNLRHFCSFLLLLFCSLLLLVSFIFSVVNPAIKLHV